MAQLVAPLVSIHAVSFPDPYRLFVNLLVLSDSRSCALTFMILITVILTQIQW